MGTRFFSIVLLIVLGFSASAFYTTSSFGIENCGIVDGQTVCTSGPGHNPCDIVNGEMICIDPPGCGYVNGVYNCGSATAFVPTPASAAGSTLKPAVYDAAIRDGTQWMANYVNSLSTEGETGPLGRFGRWLIQKAMTGYLSMKLQALTMAWGIAKGILEDFSIFQQLASAWSGLPSDFLAVANFFKLPAGLNLLINAAATRFVLKFMPSW
ncbi:MAG: hypothetical protein JWQ90_2559 [Hydrocarboniphaga sp.]|nr:hypothetical protein [Hydrocarboniphaga sp.]